MENSAIGALPDAIICEIVQWRRDLHRWPELSGQEQKTAANVVEMLQRTRPRQILTGLGGHGIAAIYDSGRSGPSVMLRCELDALPIQELNDTLPHQSQVPGVAHLCGHDGHMAIMLANANWLSRHPPRKGRVILLFQPAEENGEGAEKVIDDPQFTQILPDYAFALHNLPGLPFGHASLCEGPAHCASRGMKIILQGRTAHASQPEDGISPALALSRLSETLSGLCSGETAADPDFTRTVVTYAQLGMPGFGTTPDQAELHVTLRTQLDTGMTALIRQAEELVHSTSLGHGLTCAISYHDIFRHCENAPEAVAVLHKAMGQAGIPFSLAPAPLRGSEDFGRFSDHAPAAMVLLGSGTDLPSLHNPDFDFPDRLIPIGLRLFANVVRNLCGSDTG